MRVTWPGFSLQEILNGDVGGGFSGVQVASGWFNMWRASGIGNEAELYWTAIGGLVMAMIFAGWFHYHKAKSPFWYSSIFPEHNPTCRACMCDPGQTREVQFSFLVANFQKEGMQ